MIPCGEDNVIPDDEDHKKLLKAKGERSWREFIMTLAE